MTDQQIQVGEASIHVVTSGPPDGPALLLLHGWPEDWSSWSRILELASVRHRVVAIDLPGIGKSLEPAPLGRKAQLARRVRGLVEAMDLENLCLVGHDIGGMVAYAYLRLFPDLRCAAILDTVIPGLEPWEEVRRNPYLWHFAFQNIPGLPETLVKGHEAAYFDFFYDALTVQKASIPESFRRRYVAAYSSDSALHQGFELYRAFAKDAEENAAFARQGPVNTPLLYLRGAGESGKIEQYLSGLREAGIQNLHSALIPNAGHFAPEEAPLEVWQAIEGFLEAGS